MRKRGIFLSIFLSVSVFLFGIGASQTFALSVQPEQSSITNERTISKVTTQISKHSSDAVYYRVTVTSASGFSDSITVNITLQKNEGGSWVDKGSTISKTEKKVHLMDVNGTISVKSLGSGSYRIKVTASDVYNGITHSVGPFYSSEVLM